MSTNFYWNLPRLEPQTVETPTGKTIHAPGWDDKDPDIHIAKIYTTTHGPLGFMWAQEPSVVLGACNAHAEDAIIREQYGETLTGAQFAELVAGIEHHETDSVGERFS